MLSDFINLQSEDEYMYRYKQKYCQSPLIACDGLPITFSHDVFGHAFYKRSQRRLDSKDTFDLDRAARIDWIADVLQDKSIKIHAGYDNKRKLVDHSRRVKVVPGEMYAVIVRVNKQATIGFFNTAWIIDDPIVLQHLIQRELWDPSKIR